MSRKETGPRKSFPRIKRKGCKGQRVVGRSSDCFKSEAGLGSARYFTTNWNEAEWLRLPEVPITVIV